MMIGTQLLNNGVVILNVGLRTITLVEIFEAAEQTQALPGNTLLVLWDFRRCKLLQPPQFAARQLVGVVANSGQQSLFRKEHLW